jgi:HD-like signal output (HDOD) protein
VPLPNELATAALLHDIGKLVLARFLGPRLVELLRVAQEVDGLTAVQAETTLLEVHHGELGGIIAQHWRLPTSIVAAVTYHHSPEQVDDPIAWGARIADLLAHVAQGRTDRDEPEARRVALDRLGIAESRWETMVSTVTARFEELASRYHA